MKKKALFLLTVFFISSCVGRNSGNHKPQESCINQFHIGYGLNNPEAIVFKIIASDSLKVVLLREEWDSLLIRGDILDTLENWSKEIKTFKEDNSDTLILTTITAKLYLYSQTQLDSISSRAYNKIEISIFSKDKTWKLKPCHTVSSAPTL